MLTLTNIQKTFGIGTVNEKAALRGIDLHLDAGDFVTVLGSNGAGKSTLFGAIAGAFRLDSGSVVLDGQDITLLPDYKRSKVIGRLFQDPLRGTAPSMTIEENMALAYLRASHSRSPFSHITAADRREFREKLSMLGLGLEDRMDHPVGLLSGGQRQAPAEKVLGLTRQIVAENHITCMMITHNIPSALSLGNRTIMMSDGRIVMELEGDRRKNMTTEELLKAFRVETDRMLFSAE